MERHQYRRQRERKNSEKPTGAWITTAVILASVVLIGVMIWLSPLGAWIREHVIEPVTVFVKGEPSDKSIVSALKTQETQASVTPTASPDVTPDPVKKTVKTVQATPFYILQMGTYLDLSTAQEHADTLQQMGAAGVIYPDGSVYRVFAAAYRDESSLLRVQAQVRADGFEATPYITEQSTVRITLEGTETAISEASSAIDCLGSVPQQLCEISLSYDKKLLDRKQVLEKLNELISAAESVTETFRTQTDGEMLQPVLSVIRKYRDTISTFAEECDTISENELSGALKRLQIETILNYIRFFDQK